jgi:hypothetical protein
MPTNFGGGQKSRGGTYGSGRSMASRLHTQQLEFREPSVTVLDDTAISLAQAALTIREAMKDKSYQGTPIGVMVARYIRWLRMSTAQRPRRSATTRRSWPG